MSIPPLVCSTPPPPEQCEDDKDPEDFDIQYHLSQDDDDDNDFGYRDFTGFNSSHTEAVENSSHVNLSKQNSGDSFEESSKNSNEGKLQITSEKSIEQLNPEVILNHNSDIPCEDVNIEDLNLNVTDDSISNSIKDNLEIKDVILTNVDTDINNLKDLQSHIPCTSSDIDISQCDYKISPETSAEPLNKSNVVNEEEHDRIDETNTTIFNIDSIEKIDTEETTVNAIENDFEDFDDFKFISTDDKPTIVIDVGNPWQSNNFEDATFGDFTANFEENDNKIVESQENSNETSQTIEENIDDADDEFGDFDEFKCSSTEDKVNDNTIEELTTNSVPVINFQVENEPQLIESINKVIHSIFKEEISNTDSEICSNLETSLGETWGHLKETDTRQPYIVNWNNSLAQKTLLKSLCIDSRNILFGPKWSCNMPKYAANLSVAPLLPQKQTSQIDSLKNDQSANLDKSGNKGAWVDPFTSDGQEFTYAEALLLDLEHLMATLDQMAHSHSSLKISELLSTACSVDNENETGPTDLDVFEAALSTKTDKIYSSTLNIQPIRQINLPDTHIFTPTDSETPRSKTIHYDTAHTILMPQQVTALKPSSESFPPTIENSNTPESDDYWEFQGFKGTPDISRPIENKTEDDKSTDTNSQTQKPIYTYETQVLQPIKLEPIIPTLNWPNPGEVKETFEDFTDFISKTAPVTDPSISANIQQNILNTGEHFNGENKDNFANFTTKQIDDFDTFQSALPSATNLFETVNAESVNGTVIQNISDLEVKCPKHGHGKSNNISIHTKKSTGDKNQTEDTKEMDSFDTFQSAVTSPTDVFEFVNAESAKRTVINNISELDTKCPKHGHGKSNNISLNSKQSTGDKKITTDTTKQIDGFDTFQSALPSHKNVFQLVHSEPANGSDIHDASDLEAKCHRHGHVRSNNISLPNKRPTVNKNQNTDIKSDDPKFTASSFVKPIANSHILQPTTLTPAVIQPMQQTGQILQPLSLESYSQINWPNPGIDLQDLSRFNPVESLQSLKTEMNTQSKNSSPIHHQKTITNHQGPEEDIWGEFVSSAPKPQVLSKKATAFADDDEWTDFVSSPSSIPQNGLNTISLNVHTNSNIQKSSSSSKYPLKSNENQLEIPALNYITPKTSTHKNYNEKHFQNL